MLLGIRAPVRGHRIPDPGLMAEGALNRVIYACDVGSVKKGKFAWARVVPGLGNPKASTSINHLVTQLLQDITEGLSIALGFEAPLFLPVPACSTQLSRGRNGEENRSMFAASGATVTTLGIHEAAWILRAIHDSSRQALTYTLDWNEWPPEGESQSLFLWEAFISGSAHSETHKHDAATAAVFFRDNEKRLNLANAVTAEHPLNAVHITALWAGWANDLDRLHQPCLVLRPEQPYTGGIDTA